MIPQCLIEFLYDSPVLLSVFFKDVDGRRLRVPSNARRSKNRRHARHIFVHV